MFTKKRPDIIRAILQWIENDATLILQNVAHKVREEFDVNVCKTTIKKLARRPVDFCKKNLDRFQLP